MTALTRSPSPTTRSTRSLPAAGSSRRTRTSRSGGCRPNATDAVTGSSSMSMASRSLHLFSFDIGNRWRIGMSTKQCLQNKHDLRGPIHHRRMDTLCRWQAHELTSGPLGGRPAASQDPSRLLVRLMAPPCTAVAAATCADERGRLPPAGRLSGWFDRAVLAAAYLGSVLARASCRHCSSIASQGCGQCPRNLLLVRDDPVLFSDLNRVGVQLGLGWSLATMVLLARQVARSTPALVRLRVPVAAAAVAFLGLVAWDF
jgi:hypothetical protein